MLNFVVISLCCSVSNGFNDNVQGIITGSSLSIFIRWTVDLGIFKAAARSLIVFLWKRGSKRTALSTSSWFHFRWRPQRFFSLLEQNCRTSRFWKFSSARAQTLLIDFTAHIKLVCRQPLQSRVQIVHFDHDFAAPKEDEKWFYLVDCQWVPSFDTGF